MNRNETAIRATFERVASINPSRITDQGSKKRVQPYHVINIICLASDSALDGTRLSVTKRLTIRVRYVRLLAQAIALSRNKGIRDYSIRTSSSYRSNLYECRARTRIRQENPRNLLAREDFSFRAVRSNLDVYGSRS